MDTAHAQRVAQDYLRAAGYQGTVTVNGNEIHVEARGSVQPRFVSLFGINSMPVKGSANATLLTQ